MLDEQRTMTMLVRLLDSVVGEEEEEVQSSQGTEYVKWLRSQLTQHPVRTSPGTQQQDL
jgi:hypothetical protein